MFDTLMDPNRQERLTVSQLKSEAEDILVAGSDTTATTLTYACVHLARQPHLWERLYREISPVYGPLDQIPPLRQLENISLLVACVKESMFVPSLFSNCSIMLNVSPGTNFLPRWAGLRLAAPSPSYLWRTVPEEGYQLTCGDKGYFVPADTTIGMSAWVEQFDKDIFPDPEEFKPSRWLGPDNGTSGPRGNLDRYLVAFSKGTRQCGGMNLAYMEMYLALAAMIVRFRVKGEAEPGKEMVQREQFVGLLQVRDSCLLFCLLPFFRLGDCKIGADDVMCLAGF